MQIQEIAVSLHHTIKTNNMIAIKITPEIEKEVKESINQFQTLIDRENKFSYDLRKHDKIEVYNTRIDELMRCLQNGQI